VGNVVFSRNRYGAYIRTRVIPTLVTNTYTTGIRGRLAGLSQAWAGLDEDEKVAWETWARENPIVDRMGDQQILQGSAAFIQINMRILACAGTQIDVPPIAVAPSPITGLTMTAETGVGDVALAWTSGALAASECLVIWAAVVNSAGRRYYKNALKQVFISAAAATTPQDIKAEIEARFGTLAVGQVMYIHAFVYDDETGLSSSVAIAQTTVVDPA
jgi:hypothetical protein